MAKDKPKRHPAAALASMRDQLTACLNTVPDSLFKTQLLATAGITGRVLEPSLADYKAVDFAKQRMCEALSDWTLNEGEHFYRLEMIDDVGWSLLGAPKLLVRTGADKNRKALQKVSFIAKAHPQCVRPENITDAEGMIAVTHRSLVISTDTEIEAVLQKAQRVGLIRNTKGIAPFRAVKVDSGVNNLKKAVLWLLATPKQAFALTDSNPAKSLLPTGAFTQRELLRMVEVQSLMPLGTVLTGGGALKSVVQTLRGKIAAFQRSSSDLGLQEPFDVWETWIRFRQSIGQTDDLPPRLDLPLSLGLKRAKRSPSRPPTTMRSPFAKGHPLSRRPRTRGSARTRGSSAPPQEDAG